jgi:hypothetical protein
MLHTIPVALTKKGHRLWLQDTNARYCFPVGARYDVTYTTGTVLVVLNPQGKRTITAGKGGVIDLTSNKVTKAMVGFDRAMVTHGNGRIALTGTHT